MALRPEDIKQGRFYRFRGSNTIFAMIFEWPADGDRPRELEYASIHHYGEIQNETRRQSAEQLAAWCSCEVKAKWSNVEPDKPDPRQTDVGVRAEHKAAKDPFIAGLLE